MDKNLRREIHEEKKEKIIQRQLQSKDEEKFVELEEDSQKILLKLNTVFPFKLFTDTLIINQIHVILIKREFFSSGNIQTIMLEDVGGVNAQVGIFFGTLTINPKLVGSSPISVKYLKRSEALKARDLIQQLASAIHEKINVDKLPSSFIKNEVDSTGEQVKI